MKTLYKRELRRFAPYALGLTLIVWAYGFWGGGSPSADEVRESADFARRLSLGILLLPALLGVAAVAPDTSSGGVAFLARLPLTPVRALAAKAGAALTWWLPVVLAAAFAASQSLLASSGVSALDEGRGFLWLATNMSLYATFGFGAGLLASVVAARSLPAVLITPSLGISGVLLVAGVPFLALRVPMGEDFTALVVALTGVAFVGVAFLAYARGDRHRASFRPAVLAAAALVPLFVVGFGLTAAAHAWTVRQVVPELLAGPTPGTPSPDGELLAIPLEGQHWTGLEQRVAIVSRVDRQAWVPSIRYAVEPQFSPDSTRLVLRHALDPGGWLVDLEARDVHELYGASPSGIGFEDAIWSPEGPYFVRGRGDWVEGFDPTQPCDYDPKSTPPAATGMQPFGADWTYLGVRGQALVFSHPQRGLVEALPQRGAGNPCPLRVDLAQATPLVAWPAEVIPLTILLAPDAQHALVLPKGEERASRLLLCDLRGGGSTWLHTSSDGLRLEETRVSWSPQQKFVAVEYPNGRIGVFNLVSGVQCTELASSRPSGSDPQNTGRVYRQGPVVWSPSGNRLATPAGLLVELGAEPEAEFVWEDVETTTGDRYFTTNHDGVVFYTSAGSFQLNEGECAGDRDPHVCVECTVDRDPHVCKGPEACYDPVGLHGEAYAYVLRERAARQRLTPQASGSSSDSGSDLDSRFRASAKFSGEMTAVTPTAAFLDGHTVIRLFEPLSFSSLNGRAATSLLKGGE